MAVVTVTDWFLTHVHVPDGGENLQDLTIQNEMGPGVSDTTPSLYGYNGGYGGAYVISGVGFTYDASGQFTGGVVTQWDVVWEPTELRYSITGLSIPATALLDPTSSNPAPIIFAGDDSMTGSNGGDVLAGYQGNDTILASAGADRVYGDLGDDLLQGNRGNDTLDGGGGADTVHGGQGADLISGGDGDDWLSGDRGDDTLTGGPGADVFHSSGEGGTDWVTDFNPAEGDRIELDPGTSHMVELVGGYVVVTLSVSAQIVLAGVSLGSLTGDWIVAA